MKIVVFSDLWPPVFLGGYEIGAAHVVAELRRRGHEVLILAAHEYHALHAPGSHAHGEHSPADKAALLDTGLCVFGSLTAYIRRRKLAFLLDLARTLRARQRYRAAIRAFRPDAFLAFNPLGVAAAVLDDLVAYSRVSGAPVNCYVSDHWVAAWPSGNPMWQLVSRFRQSGRRYVRGAARVAGKLLWWAGLLPSPLPLVDRYFYCSDFIRTISQANSVGIAEHVVVHWGLPPSARPEPLPADHFDGPGPLTLLYAGQVLDHKGLPVLLRALARCRARHPLVVIGDDTTDHAARYKKLAARLGVLEQVRFVGKKDNRETLALLSREGQVLVVPSVWDEPFSIVVLEGMGVGLPVVASDTGGTPEAITNGETGFLFARGNARQLAGFLDLLDADRDLCRQVGARARQRVLERFTMEGMVDQLLAHLAESAAAGRKAAA
jgi:glycosyltransferase involved in cell wall biosynthesis